MSTSTNLPAAEDVLSLRNRVTELESVLRTILEQINTHQIYDMDARVMIRRALSGSERFTQEIDHTEVGAASRRATEFPSFFPSASSSANIL